VMPLAGGGTSDGDVIRWLLSEAKLRSMGDMSLYSETCRFTVKGYSNPANDPSVGVGASFRA
jgi:hypothetical protein